MDPNSKMWIQISKCGSVFRNLDPYVQLRIRIYRCLFCFLCWDPNLELLFHLLLNTHLSLVGPKLGECCQVCHVARSGLPELKFRWFPAICFFARGLLEILELFRRTTPGLAFAGNPAAGAKEQHIVCSPRLGRNGYHGDGTI